MMTSRQTPHRILRSRSASTFALSGRRALPKHLAGVALLLASGGCSGDDSTGAGAPMPGPSAPTSEGSPGSGGEAAGAPDPSSASQGSMPGADSSPDGPAATPDSERPAPTDLSDESPEGAPSGGGEGDEGAAEDPGAEEMAAMDPVESDPVESEPGESESGESEPPLEEVDPAVPSAGCGQARTLADGVRTMTSSGVDREYFLATPEGYDNTVPHRLVFMFHWNFGSINAIVNPPDADQNTDRPFYGMGDLTDDRTIFVVPQGLVTFTGGRGWANTNNQDVIFTDDMLEAVTSDLCIDESRVFTTGFSFGAAMSYKLACARSDVFRAAAVYNVGNFSGVQNGECNSPIAYFATHGVTDGVAQYQGGVSILNQFASLNGCTAMAPPQPGENDHACVSFEGCSVPTRFCNFGNGQDNPHNPSLNGHYPSAKDPGQATSWIPAEAWEFITQF